MKHFGKYSNVEKDFDISIDTEADPALFLNNLYERYIDFLIEANQEDFKIELGERLTKFDFLIEANQEDFKIGLGERLTKFDFLIEASQEDFKIGLGERLTKIEAFILDNVHDVNLCIHETPQRYSIILDNVPDVDLFVQEPPQRHLISIENALVLLSSEATFVMRTLRILGDMDNNYLLNLDDFELDNLDYIIT